MIDAAKALDIPISSFHFGLATSIAQSATSSPEPHEISGAEGPTRAFADANIKVVANVKPCLLGDHPTLWWVAAAGGFIAGVADHAPLKSQFWGGEGAHIDFTHPAGVA